MTEHERRETTSGVWIPFDKGEPMMIDGAQVVDGGEIGTPAEPEVEHVLAHRRLGTASQLAFMVLGLLGLTFLVHYSSVLYLTATTESFEDMEKRIGLLGQIFDVWLPVISGLAGSAATYFFTKARDKSD